MRSGDAVRRAACPRPRRRPTPPTADPRCGQYKGALAHRKRGEYLCTACAVAEAKYQAEWRVRSGRAQAVQIPVKVLVDLVSAAPAELRSQAQDALGFDLVAAHRTACLRAMIE